MNIFNRDDSWLLLSTAWSCKRFWYIILAEILCCLNSLKSGGRSENNNFLNFTSLLMIESWSCSVSLWILLYILFTSSWEETCALYFKRFPFSVQRANALFFVCSLARISDSDIRYQISDSDIRFTIRNL